MNWTRRRGSTPSSSTGPSVDHTLGNGIKIVSLRYIAYDNCHIFELLSPNSIGLDHVYRNLFGSAFSQIAIINYGS